MVYIAASLGVCVVMFVVCGLLAVVVLGLWVAIAFWFALLVFVGCLLLIALLVLTSLVMECLLCWCLCDCRFCYW